MTKLSIKRFFFPLLQTVYIQREETKHHLYILQFSSVVTSDEGKGPDDSSPSSLTLLQAEAEQKRKSQNHHQNSNGKSHLVTKKDSRYATIRLLSREILLGICITSCEEHYKTNFITLCSFYKKSTSKLMATPSK